LSDISLEAFAATEFNEIFSDRQPRQNVNFPETSENRHISKRLSAQESLIEFVWHISC